MGNKIIISPTAANPSPSHIPYGIAISHDSKGAMTIIIVIPQMIHFVFLDLPRPIINTIDITNTKATITIPIANLNPPIL